jgi:hypothetical protein
MLQSSSEFNNLGAGGFPTGGFGGFGGGMGVGGFGLIGLIGLQDLFNKRRGDDGDGNCQKEIATLAAISNLKDISVAEARVTGAAINAVGDKVCELEKTSMQQFYAQAIQAANIANDQKALAVQLAIAQDQKTDAATAAILARINQSEVDSLRDSLLLERRRSDAKEVEISINNSNTSIASAIAAQSQAQLQAQLQLVRDGFDAERRRADAREVEINVTNSNTSIQAQVQAQAQAQAQKQAQDKFDIDRKFDLLFGQVAKSSQDIINVGGLLAGVAQTANPTNVK